MQVRYLGREERRLYEVIVAKNGSLIWRKDGQKVDTTDEWRDSVEGIVKVDDPAPLWADRPAFARGSSESSSLNEEADLGVGQVETSTSDVSTQSKDKPSDDKPKRHQSIRDVLTSPISKRRDKRPKQKWIFVSIHARLGQVIAGLQAYVGSRHKEQPLHRDQATGCFPAFFLLAWLQGIRGWSHPRQRRAAAS